MSSNRLTEKCISNLTKLDSLESLYLDQNKIKARDLFYRSPSSMDHRPSILLGLRSTECPVKGSLLKAIPILTTEARGVAFTQLEFLDLSDNPLSSETDILPLASCPQLQALRICRTKLARSYKGWSQWFVRPWTSMSLEL